MPLHYHATVKTADTMITTRYQASVTQKDWVAVQEEIAEGYRLRWL